METYFSSLTPKYQDIILLQNIGSVMHFSNTDDTLLKVTDIVCVYLKFSYFTFPHNNADVVKGLFVKRKGMKTNF